MNVHASAFAVLTPPGRGGIAVLRCVGPDAAAALQKCFRPARPSASILPAPGALAYGHLVDGDGRPLDEVILCRAPVFEVNCHGGPAAVAAACGRLAALGLRRVDADTLLELEGAGAIARAAGRALRSARTPLAARILLAQLDGALGRETAAAAADLAAGRAAEACARLGALLGRWRECGRFLADAPRIVIAGRPNVGKSTLLNRLVGADRAITAPTPGTTRDYVEAEAALEGLPVVLVDTAGLREAADEIERLGVERAHGQAARAALVVYLLDACEGATSEDEAMLARLGDRALAAWNKCDAVDAKKGTAPERKGTVPCSASLFISALTGAGVEALVAAVLGRLAFRPPEIGAAVPFTAEQAASLGRARALAASGDAAAARQALASVSEPRAET